MIDKNISKTKQKKILSLYNENRFHEAKENIISLIRDYPEDIFCLKMLGIIYGRLGDHKKALEINKKIIDSDKNDFEAYNNLGISYKNLNLLDEAISSFKQSLKLNQNYADTYHNLANVYEILGKDNESFEAILKAVKCGPSNLNTYCKLARNYMDQSKFELAMKCYEHALLYGEDNLELYIDYATCLSRTSKHDEALKYLHKVIALDPNNFIAYNNMGIAYQSIGKKDKAIEAYEKAISLNKSFAEPYYNIGANKKWNINDNYLDDMKNILQSDNTLDERKAIINFAIAKTYGDIGDYKNEFKYLKKGNSIREIEFNYDENDSLNFFEKIKSNFCTINKQSLTKLDVSINQIPIFIVSMPRSGTTLIEQIITCDDAVHGCDELPYINGYGKDLSLGHRQVDKKELINFRNRYLQELSKISTESKMLTDKDPSNFRYLGIISSAFPEAKIIHVKRQPEAVCWGIYKKCFVKSSKELAYAYNLQHIKNYYKQYRDLMKFYSKHIAHRIFELDYDNLVNNQETVTKELIKYLDLEWDKKFLNPQDNQRAVSTASSNQVRSKIYKGSSSAWERYKPFLNNIFNDLEY